MRRVEGHYSDDLTRGLKEEADGHKGEDGKPLLAHQKPKVLLIPEAQRYRRCFQPGKRGVKTVHALQTTQFQHHLELAGVSRHSQHVHGQLFVLHPLQIREPKGSR